MRAPNLGTEHGLFSAAERERNTQLAGITESRRGPEGEEVLSAADNIDKPMFTGRYFILLDDRVSPMKAKSMLENKAGIRSADMGDFSAMNFREELIPDADALIYEDLGIALVSGDQEQIGILENVEGFIRVPELVVYALPGTKASINSTQWNIEAVKAERSTYTGMGVKLAVLDTGLDLTHPHFQGRQVASRSFAETPDVQDGNGHGTHCIGSAAGWVDDLGVRFGVAYDSHIHAGKVLGDNGRGAQAWILNGMTWAREQRCKVISLSLGSMVYSGYHLEVYERAARAAMLDGAVVVAAAGNGSNRPGMTSPVGCPANCASVVSVGAVDRANLIAWFSNRAMNSGPGHAIDLVAPGVDIRSTWSHTAARFPGPYRSINGTSMATPHVAGLLALLWEEFPQASPQEIIDRLLAKALALPLDPLDAGKGLAQA